MNYYAAPMEGLTDRHLAAGPPALVRCTGGPGYGIMRRFSRRRRTGCSSKRRWLSWNRG